MTIHDLSKTAFTTISAMVGGISKALSLSYLTFSAYKFVEVGFYAAISATVGYLVKCGLDRMVAYYKRRKIRKTRKP